MSTAKTVRARCYGCLLTTNCTVVGRQWRCADCTRRSQEAAAEAAEFGRAADNWREHYGDE